MPMTVGFGGLGPDYSAANFTKLPEIRPRAGFDDSGAEEPRFRGDRTRTAVSVGGDAELQRRLSKHRERPVSERFGGDGAPPRSDIKRLHPELLDSTLQVRLLRASGLAARDDIGSADPYVEVWVWCPGDPSFEHMWRSSTKLRTTTPVWDEHIEALGLTRKRAMMHVVLFDYDKVGTDDFLGEALVALDEYLDGRKHHLQLELDVLAGNNERGQITGYVQLEITTGSAGQAGPVVHHDLPVDSSQARNGQPDAQAAARGLNDNARGIDRLGFRFYAMALASMLRAAEPPLCVGLYARWGSGKTFMISLLLKYLEGSGMDPDRRIHEDPETRELLQYFEEGYPSKPDTAAQAQQTSEPMSWSKVVYEFLTGILQAMLPEVPYWLATLWSILCDAISLHAPPSLQPGSSTRRGPAASSGYEFQRLMDDDPEEGKQPQAQEQQIEYVFVYFNAWEFSSSDELWAGLVRNMYTKVEQRIAFSRGGNFKRQWRVERAKKQLEERFGRNGVRQFVVYSAACVLISFVLIVLEFTGWTKLLEPVKHAIGEGTTMVAGVFATVAALVPPVGLAAASSTESSVSGGERIFQQAASIKDKLGFLAKVKAELQLLFDFLRRFGSANNVRLIIVPIVDDLDRCITDGRNVKVLEAMQLILSVPGAPILSFLAVDSRIVVASIEDYFAKVIDKSNISGWEYLDKIVQLPFALPEPPAEKVKRLLLKSLEGSTCTPEQVARRIRAFEKHFRELLTPHRPQFFKFAAAVGEETPPPVDLGSILSAIGSCAKDAPPMDLILAAGKAFGGAMLRRADRLDRDREQTHIMDEEDCEILCSDVNAVLEACAVPRALRPGRPEDDLDTPGLGLDTPKPTPEPAASPAQDGAPGANASHGKGGSDASPAEAVSDLHNADWLGADDSSDPLVSARVMGVFSSLSHLLEPNPRRLKRIINVFSLISEVARMKPITGRTKARHRNSRAIASDPRWDVLSPKLVKWVCLCECFPYRMSFLVLTLTDFVQKALVNRLRAKHPSKGSYGLVYYTANKKATADTAAPEDEPDLELSDDMPIVEAYFRHVERYIYSHKSAAHLLGLDGDSVRFAAAFAKLKHASPEPLHLTPRGRLSDRPKSTHVALDRSSSLR